MYFRFILIDIVSMNNIEFSDRFNAIISDHITSTEGCHLHRGNIDERELGTVLHKIFKTCLPEILNLFPNNQSDGANDRQKQERDDNDRLIQHVLENDKKLAELARIEQENYARYEQHLLEYDERLRAFMRFQKQEEQNRARSAQEYHEHLVSLIQVPKEPERKDRISEELLLHVQQLTQLVVQQQEQHAREIQTLHQLVHRSLENNELLRRVNEQSPTSSSTQLQQGYHFNLDLFNKMVQTIVLLWTLIILFKK
jgi:hypothetical protein